MSQQPLIDQDQDGTVDSLERLDFLIRSLTPVILLLVSIAIAVTGAVISNQRLIEIGSNGFYAGLGGSGVAAVSKAKK